MNGIVNQSSQSVDSGAQNIKHADNKTLLGPGGGGAGDNRCAAHYQWSPAGPGDSGDDLIGESQYWDDNNIDLATRKLSRDNF